MTQPVQDTSGLIAAKEAMAPEAASEPTVTAVGGAEVHMVAIPDAIYDTAQEDNRQRTFTHELLAARTPQEGPAYVPPPVCKGILDQTKAEMEAGAKRVAEFAEAEIGRKIITDAHKNDKWVPQGSVPVFRPGDFVPDQRKGQGYVGGRAVNVG